MDTITDLIERLEFIKEQVGDLPLKRKLVLGPPETAYVESIVEVWEVDDGEEIEQFLVIG